VRLARESVLIWPGYISLALNGVQGLTLSRGDWRFHELRAAHQFELNRVGPIELMLVDPREEADALLRVLFDVVWNAANHPRCEGFNEVGKYVGYPE
jgi:hypothetical protein